MDKSSCYVFQKEKDYQQQIATWGIGSSLWLYIGSGSLDLCSGIGSGKVNHSFSKVL